MHRIYGINSSLLLNQTYLSILCISITTDNLQKYLQNETFKNKISGAIKVEFVLLFNY